MVSVTIIQLCHLGMKATMYSIWLSKAVILDMLLCFYFLFLERIFWNFTKILSYVSQLKEDLAKMTFQPDSCRSSNFVIFTKWSGRLICTSDHLPPLSPPFPPYLTFPCFCPYCFCSGRFKLYFQEFLSSVRLCLGKELRFVSLVFVLFYLF